MRDVIVYSPIIRPGGGPSGYVYNLMTANQKFATKNKIAFHGRITHERKLAAPQSLAEKLHSYFSVRGIHLPPTQNERKLIEQSFDKIIVIHGPINSSLLYHLKKRAYKIVFMPHSPSLSCDEYLMLYSSAKRQLSNKIYSNLRWDERACFAQSDCIVFPSKNAAEVYKKAYIDIITPLNICYIASGVAIDVAENKINENYEALKSNNSITIGFIGRYNSHKGYDLFCRIADIVGSRDIKFSSFGSGPLAETSANVKDEGWVEDISSALLTIDILIVPNKMAYYDLLPLEAACHGLPMVFTPVGGNIDQAKAMPDSILAKSFELKDITDDILLAVKNKKENCRWGARNRDVFRSMFTDEFLLQRWDNFLSSIQ